MKKHIFVIVAEKPGRKRRDVLLIVLHRPLGSFFYSRRAATFMELRVTQSQQLLLLIRGSPASPKSSVSEEVISTHHLLRQRPRFRLGPNQLHWARTTPFT